MTYAMFICSDTEVMLPDIMVLRTSSVGKKIFITNKENMTPLPVVTRSKAWTTAARLLGLWVRILPETWMFVSCECCVLSGRGLYVGLITLPEESY
jgi:hypothetical protein